MPRSLLIVVVAIILVLVGVVFLAGRASEQPVTRVEQSVSLDNLA